MARNEPPSGVGLTLSLGLAPILGGITALALPPRFWLLLLIPGFSGLLWLLERCRSRFLGFTIGWLFGFGYFVTSLSWIGRSFSVDPERFGVFAIPAVAVLCGGLAVFIGLAGLLFVMVRPARGFASLVTLAAAWTLTEWLRGTILSGFPWNLIGYVWTATDETIQLASVVGVHGLGFFTVMIAGFLTPALGGAPTSWELRILPTLWAVTGIALLWGFGVVRLDEATSKTVPGVRLKVVQANIQQSLKWLPEERRRILDRHLELTTMGPSWESTLVVWPETAIPYTLTEDSGAPPTVVSSLRGQTLLTGAVRRVVGGDGTERLFNSLVAFGADGERLMTYDKVHLVPFGEFMPLRWLIPFKKLTEGSTDFSAGDERPPYEIAGVPPFSPLICYEAIFQDHGSDHERRPRWLLNVTNDAWFGDSDGPYQHFQMARVRAVEQGVPLVRAANTGISAVIDAYGRVRRQLPLGEAGVINAELPERIERAPWFASVGNWPVLGLIVLGLISGAVSGARGRALEAAAPGGLA